MNNQFANNPPEIYQLPVQKVVENFITGVYSSINLERYAVQYIRKMGFRFSKTELLLLKKATDKNEWTLAHTLAYDGYIFSLEDLLTLDDIKDKSGRSISLTMAEANYFWKFDELVKLGNPAMVSGWTVAHAMAENGHIFSIKELMTLGNPAVTGDVPSAGRRIGWTVAHEMARARRDTHLTTKDLVTLGNPATVDEEYYDGGWTVAHEMINHGFQFQVADLLELGNPQDGEGLTLSDLMAMRGYKFSVDEMLQLGETAHILSDGVVGIRLTYYDNQPVFTDGDKISPKVELDFDRYYADDGLDAYAVSCILTMAKDTDVCTLSVIKNKGLGGDSTPIEKDEYVPENGLSNPVPEVLELIDELNRAIRNRHSFNFADYVGLWKSKHKEFHVFVPRPLRRYYEKRF